MLFILNRNLNTNLKITIMRTISKSVKNKIEAFMINGNTKEAIIYAQSKGVTAEEFGKIAGKY